MIVGSSMKESASAKMADFSGCEGRLLGLSKDTSPTSPKLMSSCKRLSVKRRVRPVCPELVMNGLSFGEEGDWTRSCFGGPDVWTLGRDSLGFWVLVMVCF